MLVEISPQSGIYKTRSLSIDILHASDNGKTDETSLAQMTNIVGTPTAFPFWFNHYGSRVKDAVSLTVTLSVVHGKKKKFHFQFYYMCPIRLWNQRSILNLFCYIAAEKRPPTVIPSALIPRKPNIILNKFAKFYGSQKFADVTLILPDEANLFTASFPCHRLVLAVKSNLLKKTTSENNKINFSLIFR